MPSWLYYSNQNGLRRIMFHPREVGIVVTSEPWKCANHPSSYDKIEELTNLTSSVILVFFGVTKEDQIVPLTWGSDITGSIIAAGVMAESLWKLFIDVDGIFAAHPWYFIHVFATLSPEFDLNAVRELAYAGFSVLAHEALLPAHQGKTLWLSH